MKNSKLIDILSAFSKEDVKKFDDFVRSPFFNKKKDLIPFYAYLKKYIPLFPDTAINRQKVFKTLYKDQAYDEKRLGYLMSYLTKLTEQYIGFQNYQNDEMMADYHLLSAFLEKDLFKYYLQENKKINTSQKELPKKSSTYFLKQYLMSEVALRYFQLQRKRGHDQNLQMTTDYLDLFYITTKLEYSCEMINRKKLLGSKYDLNLISVLESEIPNTELKKEHLVSAYLQIFKMYNYEITDESLNTLITLIQDHSIEFSFGESQKIYRYAINLCLQMLRKGRPEYMEQALELYVEGIEKGLFHENGFLSPWVYTNVIKLGIARKRYDWTEEFIQEKNMELPEEFRENALHYNLAELYYSKKDFDQAISNLNVVKFTDIIMDLGSREILAKIYYETDAEESLLSLIASFSIFLKRNKNMSAGLKRPYLNFCDLLNQLMRRNPKKLLGIKQKIQDTNPVTSKTWLLKTCDEIIKELGVKE